METGSQQFLALIFFGIKCQPFQK